MHIFVFDIETIPDDRSAINLLNIDEISTIEERRKALADYHLEITDGKNSFIRQPFHKVVAISFLIGIINDKQKIQLKQIRSGGDEKSSEEELVRGFFDTINKLKPKIISFNGRTFDIPVLKYRAMKYGISATTFHQEGSRYENYSNRYSTNWHCDLLDVLSDFGASARVKMQEVCSVMGFPGKFGVDGSNVSEMYDNNQIEHIRNYCETDVINTYLIYIRYLLHIGRLTIDSYNSSVSDLITFLEVSNKQHFLDFYEAWKTSSEGKFFI